MPACSSMWRVPPSACSSGPGPSLLPAPRLAQEGAQALPTRPSRPASSLCSGRSVPARPRPSWLGRSHWHGPSSTPASCSLCCPPQSCSAACLLLSLVSELMPRSTPVSAPARGSLTSMSQFTGALQTSLHPSESLCPWTGLPGPQPRLPLPTEGILPNTAAAWGVGTGLA